MFTISNLIDNDEVQPIKSSKKNTLTRVVKITSIVLTIFTVLFSASIISPLKFEYDSFGIFLFYCILMLIIIGILTLIIYASILFISFIWNKSSSIRQQLPSHIVSFFIANCLTCPLFMYVIFRSVGAPILGLEFGFNISLYFVLSIGGITAAILYRKKFLKLICFLLYIVGCIGIILMLSFYFIDGYDMNIKVKTPLERWPNNLTPDPSLNGNSSYEFLTYGTGFDHRIQYGIKASIITPTIDLSSIIKISSFNKNVFKYNESSLPLNGRIWYPINNKGPYPVVVMVHGNHESTESSEDGYEYLGEMLSSQGFIAVSIDENILNFASFSHTTEYGKISKIKKYSFGWDIAPEFVARSIIILETLKQFRLWNELKTNRFYHQFDLSNIGLMGHSRGGEAIAITALFNKLNYLPDYPSNVAFNNYQFGIKALFSISGTDDGYMPLGRSLQLSDITMFGIHGIYDGDVSAFAFQSKLTNLKFTSNHSLYNFKSSLYVHQANHGQFNTKWGRYDITSSVQKFLNVRPCKIYLFALMKIILKNKIEYNILFEDYRSILSFLPHTNYISTFQDSNEIIINDFEHYDVTIGTIIGSRINITNLLLWSSVYINVYRSVMLLLQPMENLIGKYTIHLQNSINGSQIRFMIGRTSEGLIDYLIVRVFYENGIFDSFIVNVIPTLTKQIFKISQEEYVTSVQTISLPLLHPIIGLEFVINGTNAQFLVDNIVIVN